MAGVDGVQRLPLLERPERSHDNTESGNNQPTDLAEEPKNIAINSQRDHVFAAHFFALQHRPTQVSRPQHHLPARNGKQECA